MTHNHANVLRDLADYQARCAVAAGEAAAVHRRRAETNADLEAIVAHAHQQARNRDADREVYLAREAALLAGAAALEAQHTLTEAAA